MTSWNEEGTAPSGSGPFPTIYQPTILFETVRKVSLGPGGAVAPAAQVVPAEGLLRKRMGKRLDNRLHRAVGVVMEFVHAYAAAAGRRAIPFQRKGGSVVEQPALPGIVDDTRMDGETLSRPFRTPSAEATPST